MRWIKVSMCIFLGKIKNETDLKSTALSFVRPGEKRLFFENCVADVNIPVGEVFTSPVLEGTNGVLNVSKVYLNELQYRDLKITFENGKITEYTCSNFEDEEQSKKYIKSNILHNHDTLPLGEFAIGTNTTAYVVAKKYQIEDKMPILIAERWDRILLWEIHAIAGARRINCIIRMERKLLRKIIRFQYFGKKMCQKRISNVILISQFRMKS